MSGKETVDVKSAAETVVLVVTTLLVVDTLQLVGMYLTGSDFATLAIFIGRIAILAVFLIGFVAISALTNTKGSLKYTIKRRNTQAKT